MRLLGSIVVATSVLYAASLSPNAGAAGVKRVVLKNIAFSPTTVTIRRGDSVRWTWRDPRVSHDVTSRGRLRFRSSATKLTGTHTVRFRRKGTYRYVCTIHPGMLGKVVVR